MYVVTLCPYCSARSRLPAECVGREAKCKCGRVFVVAEVCKAGGRVSSPLSFGTFVSAVLGPILVFWSALRGTSGTSTMSPPGDSRHPWWRLTTLPALIVLAALLAFGSLWCAGTHETHVEQTLRSANALAWSQDAHLFRHPFAQDPPADLPKGSELTSLNNVQGQILEGAVPRENDHWYILIPSWRGRLRIGLYLGIVAVLAALSLLIGAILALRRVGQDPTELRIASIGVVIGGLIVVLLCFIFWSISARVHRDAQSIAVYDAMEAVSQYASAHRKFPDALPHELMTTDGSGVHYTWVKGRHPANWILLSPKDCKNNDDLHLAVVMCAYGKGEIPRLRLLRGAEIHSLLVGNP